MLQYAAKLQDDTGMHFPLQGGDVFRKLCGIYAEFKVTSLFFTKSKIEFSGAWMGWLVTRCRWMQWMPLTVICAEQDSHYLKDMPLALPESRLKRNILVAKQLLQKLSGRHRRLR